MGASAASRRGTGSLQGRQAVPAGFLRIPSYTSRPASSRREDSSGWCRTTCSTCWPHRIDPTNSHPSGSCTGDACRCRRSTRSICPSPQRKLRPTASSANTRLTPRSVCQPRSTTSSACSAVHVACRAHGDARSAHRSRNRRSSWWRTRRQDGCARSCRRQDHAGESTVCE